MTPRTSKAELWQRIHAERARLGVALDQLDSRQWGAPTLCDSWSVEEVVAHLTAAANTGTGAWLRSIVRARFNAARHNDRLMHRHRGDNALDTLSRYHRATWLTVAPSGDLPAFLGEAVVHGQDIARPLGLSLDPDPDSVVEVARFFASKDFAVNSATLVKELHLAADDADFSVGEGPTVRGNVLDLVMAMAGRRQALASLAGPGVEALHLRLA